MESISEYFKSGFKKSHPTGDPKFPTNVSLKINSFGGMASA